MSYHSIYDTRRWYRQAVGEHYASALMITRITSLIAGRLANAPLLPIGPLRFARDGRDHLGRRRVLALGLDEHGRFAADAQAVVMNLECQRNAARIVLEPGDPVVAGEWRKLSGAGYSHVRLLEGPAGVSPMVTGVNAMWAATTPSTSATRARSSPSRPA